MSKKPWTVGTCVQINHWRDYKFAPYGEALLIPEAYIRQIDTHPNLRIAQRFDLYIAAEHERGGWLDEDGDHHYRRVEMACGRIDMYGGQIEICGFVEDIDPERRVFGHTGIFRPEMWTEYPMSHYRKTNAS